MSREPRMDGWRDVVAGVEGAGIVAGALLTPFRRAARSAWGTGTAAANGRFPGDELVARPRWAWTHGIDIRAPASAVWPWVAQIGADRAGFYSYQWLENLVGCHIRNADAIHPLWAHRTGGQLWLHPKAPPLRVVSAEDGRSLLAYTPPTASLAAQDGQAATGSGRASLPPHSNAAEPGSARGTRWMTASWLFLVQPCDIARCRLISRYRCATSGDLATRLQFGPSLIEPVGFAMDRRMLIGIKQRAEQA